MWEKGEAGGGGRALVRKEEPGWPAASGEVKQLRTCGPIPWGRVDGKLRPSPERAS